MPRAKRSLSEELKNQTEFVEGVLALVQKHFGRKKAPKPGKVKYMRSEANGVHTPITQEEFERA